MSQQSFSFKMRVVHRYLGFFLAGIMAVYALSGILLIFRDTDFLKNKTEVKKVIATNISKEELGKAIKIKKLKVDKEEGDTYFFKNGNYNKATGAVEYTKKELPFLLDKMTHLHKAKSSEPLYFLNIFFGVSLLFFVISSFWMFMPSSSIFKKGMYFTIGGILLTLLLLFI
jgi:hypothetical protein